MQPLPEFREKWAELFCRLPSPILLIDKGSEKVSGWNVAFEECFSKPELGECWQAILEPHEQIPTLLNPNDGQPKPVFHFRDQTKQWNPYRAHTLEVDGSTVCLVLEAMSAVDRRYALLQHALHGTGARVGTDYFQHCVQTLSEAFCMSHAMIAIRRPGESFADTVAFFGKESQLSNFSYSVEGTPCGAVYESPHVVVVNRDAQQAFPEDEDLAKFNIESYVGIPILNQQNEVMGHLALLDTEPFLSLSDEEETILKIFAARTGAEFRRLDVEADLRLAKQVAEEASQSKTRFLANISHELRSPLNAILGFAQLLELSTGLTDQQLTTVRTINRNGEHLQSVINNILDMSRIELNDIDVNFDVVQIREILDDVRATVVPLAKAKNLPVDLLKDTAVPDVVETDRALVRQILTNLMVNAVSATESGCVRLTTTIRTVDGEIFLVFEVQDTGSGISGEDLPRLFAPFEQANPHSVGSGLGLAIASSCAIALGGTIDAESEPGRGSRFTLLLPLRNAHPIAPEEELPVANQKEALVLVVDDTESNRHVARQAMEFFGFRVEEAADGLSGIEKTLALRPDVVLMDMRMPGIDGVEAARQIRERLGKDAPAIIGVTGNLVDAHGQRLENSEFDETIGKPYKIDQLAEAVRRHLS